MLKKLNKNIINCEKVIQISFEKGFDGENLFCLVFSSFVFSCIKKRQLRQHFSVAWKNSRFAAAEFLICCGKMNVWAETIIKTAKSGSEKLFSADSKLCVLFHRSGKRTAWSANYVAFNNGCHRMAQHEKVSYSTVRRCTLRVYV